MSRAMNWLKSIRLDRILTVFLVGILMLVSTACGGSKVLAKNADDVRQEVPKGAVTSDYKGGMNDYSDVDPRQNTSEAKAKAKALVDNAQKNIDQKSVDSVEQYVENYRSGTPLGERVKRIGENVGNAAEDIREDVAKGSQENLENATDTAKSAKQVADKAPGAVESKVKSDIKTTQRALDNAGDTAGNIGERIKGAVKDVAD
jgi:F0F1-type ATP synthase membrane subunit b/b'